MPATLPPLLKRPTHAKSGRPNGGACDTRQHRFTFTKALGEDGTFTGLASVYGVVDWYNDIVQVGAYRRTIELTPEVPILWQHDPTKPIGKGRLEDSPAGLILHGKLELGVAQAREAYDLIKAGVIDGLSIGYDIVDRRWEDEFRYLLELRVWEVSIVTFPANHASRITGVKSKRRALPVAEGAKWGGAAAEQRVREWSGAGTEPNEKYLSAFLVVDGEKSGYAACRWQIADVVDGELRVVPEALRSAAREIEGAGLGETERGQALRELDRYRDLLGTKSTARDDAAGDTPRPTFERSMRRQVSTVYGQVSEVKLGQGLSPAERRTAEVAVDAIVDLLEADTALGGEPAGGAKSRLAVVEIAGVKTRVWLLQVKTDGGAQAQADAPGAGGEVKGADAPGDPAGGNGAAAGEPNGGSGDDPAPGPEGEKSAGDTHPLHSLVRDFITASKQAGA